MNAYGIVFSTTNIKAHTKVYCYNLAIALSFCLKIVVAKYSQNSGSQAQLTNSNCCEINLAERYRIVSPMCDGSFSAVTDRSSTALLVAGPIPARNIYLYGLQVVVAGLAVCVCEFLSLLTYPRFRN